VLYYGDEIGMANVVVPAELRRDRMTRDMAGGGRDRGRTPMPWDASPSGGFTANGVKPWLPLGDAAARNVAGEREDPASVLSFCRSLLALRRAELGGQIAAYERLPATDGVWAYRTGGLTVAANFSDTPLDAPGPPGEILLSTTSGAPSATGVIGPWQGTIARNATPP
jgi:alpha-glucosidase